MRTSMLGLTIAVAAGLGWAAASAHQDQAPVPGPGTGIVKVMGTVDVGNVPGVIASQSGAWTVGIAGTPDVRVVGAAPVILAAPGFLNVKSRYEITWPAGEREVVQVLELDAGGWARVQGNARDRWVNVAHARAVEIAP